MPIKPKSKPTKVLMVPDYRDANGLWARRTMCTEGDFYVQRATRALSLWESIRRRIAGEGSYEGVRCLFKGFQEFAEWCQTQPGYGAVDSKGQSYELDKDILHPGRRCYSEETCRFVPRYENGMFVTSGKLRGPWPIGVFLNKPRGKFQARGSINGESVYLGIFKTADVAHVAWQKNKAARLRVIYEEYSKDPYSTREVLNAIALRILALDNDILYGKETVSL